MKKIYIIISIIVILIISIFIYLELTPEINKEDNLLVYDIASLKKTILEKNKIMLDQLFLIDSMIDDDDELQEFFYINDANSFEKTGIGFFLYKNNLLKYWSTNNIPLPSSATPFFFKDKILNLNNGWYSVECIIEDEYIIVGLFLIKKEYSYENDLLETGFNHLLDIPSNFDIIRDSAEFAIPVVLFSDKGDFFLLKNYTSSEDAINQLSLALKFLIIALFICLIIATYILFVQLRPSNKCLISLISIVLIIVGRFLMLKYGFPDFFDTLKLFSPELFAESQWLPSFGDYIINVILFLVVAIIYSNGVKFNVSIKKNIFVDIIISASLAIILIVVSRFITGLFHGLVWNSSISFSYDNIIALDIYSFIGLGLIVSILCGFIIIYNQIVSELKAIISLKIFAVCLILVFAISYLIQVYPYEWSISSLIFSFSFLFLWLTIAYLKIFNKKHSYYQLLILILLLSIIIAEHFSRLSKEKEEDMELVLAYNLATERDVGAEFFLAQINQELISDSTVIKASFNQDYEKIRSIINNKFLTNRYFNKYEIQITICLDIDSLLIAPDNISVKCFDFFDEIIDNYGVMLPETNFWFLDNHNGRISYFGNIELIENFDYTTRVFIELNSRIFSEGLGYPELLLEKKLTVKKMIKEYNHAKYHNGKLVTSKGNFKYPILFKHDNYNISSDNYFYYNDFKHLVYKPDDNNIIIISKEGSDYSKELVAFSYIYAILFLFFNILWLLFGLRKGIRIKSFTLKAKIQSSFISILILSLIITGSIAIYFIIKGYKEKQNEFLEDKVQSILVELEREFGHQNSFDVSEIQYLNYLLVRLSNVFYTDINLYDEDGKLFATSRREIYNQGLKGRYLDTEAYRKLIIESSGSVIISEEVGKVNYLSAYIPFRNNNNELIAYLNLPYFARQDEFREEISNFVVAFSNVFLVLILISVIIAVFISKQVTRPLAIIQLKISQMNIKEKAEKIIYEKDDELGGLIREYNRKVDELTESVNLLAKSEREMAWREMAKQIAHEIKNPLTPMKLSLQQLEHAYDRKDENWEKHFKRVAKTVVEQIDVLSEIATAFSNFAKMPDPKKEKNNITNIIYNTVQLFKSIDNVKFITTINIESEGTIEADKEQLTRVFNNLIKNSIQAIPHTREGQIHLILEENEKEYIVKVKDNGSGIDDIMVPKMFQPNFTTKSGGMGLGLSMVKNIIDSNGGTISFTTEKGLGTEFTIRLPRDK
jgi:two-component system, NtrC family, nitrogen regulation sensor histidine kinase NtrY